MFLLSLAGRKEVCEAVDYLLMEWHRMAVPDLPPNVEDSFKWLLEAPWCRTHVWNNCDQE